MAGTVRTRIDREGVGIRPFPPTAYPPPSSWSPRREGKKETWTEIKQKERGGGEGGRGGGGGGGRRDECVCVCVSVCKRTQSGLKSWYATLLAPICVLFHTAYVSIFVASQRRVAVIFARSKLVVNA